MDKPRILVIYATWHGHARDVAEQVAAVSLVSGVEAHVRDARDLWRDGIDDQYTAFVVVSSVHFGVHPRVLQRLVSHDLLRLSGVPSAFISVSGAAASLDGTEQAEHYIERFLKATGWKPDMVYSCAGAVRFTAYDPFTRLLMKFSSRIAGRGTDTSRDYVYTNWPAVHAFTHDFLARLGVSQEKTMPELQPV